MEQLKGKIVNVVLTIQEGRCMESIKSHIQIAANFNGRILESDAVNAEDSPIFNTNLIWEIEKRELRKIRSANQPLRVECLSIDNQSQRQKFGHVLLDLRSAQIVDDDQMCFKWHKLIAVRNKKRSCVPELYLSLTIRNHLEVQKDESCEDVWQAEPRSESLIPIKYLEDGYIVVGNEQEAVEDYSLNILIRSAISLDLLLPEVLVFHQTTNKYVICLTIFGIPIKTKQFCKDLHDRIIFEEKIVIRLKSNSQILTQLFKEETFEVAFQCGCDILGVTTISFNGLSNVNEKLIFRESLFRFPSTNGIVPFGKDNRKPSINLEIFLIKNKNSTSALVSNFESGDHQQLMLFTDNQLRDLEEWKERQKLEFSAELNRLKDIEFGQEREEIEKKQLELNENVEKCKQLQQELQEKLDELEISKTLKRKRKSSTDLLEVIAENQKKFADCDKELLIEYLSNVQKDNVNLKEIISELKQKIEVMEKSALTKEQTTNLLQELKGLEEKFEAAQQTKVYFKEQWQKACQEIHHLKAEDYRQLQNQLKEQREELDELGVFEKGHNSIRL